MLNSLSALGTVNLNSTLHVLLQPPQYFLSGRNITKGKTKPPQSSLVLRLICAATSVRNQPGLKAPIERTPRSRVTFGSRSARNPHDDVCVNWCLSYQQQSVITPQTITLSMPSSPRIELRSVLMNASYVFLCTIRGLRPFFIRAPITYC